jgi:hypothetical protein
VFGAPDGVGSCSGTLIAPNLVLTAKHCVRARAPSPRYACPGPSEDLGELRSPASLTLFFGSDLSGDMTTRAVLRIVDDDQSAVCDRDAAVLVLDEPVQGITPRTLRTTALVVDEPLSAVGWGMTEFGVPDARRRRDGVVVLPPSAPVGASEIETSTAVCQGDSGGPLFDSSGRVVAVVSRVRNGCTSGTGVHVLVRAANELIERARSGT